MTTYQARLYMVLYPTEALLLSQLSPKDFVVRYSYGSTSYYEGKLIFAELDINYRHPYFQIDQAMKGLVVHPDGRPKATQYVSSYRVLEHVSLDAIKALYLGNPDGTFLELKEGSYVQPKKLDSFNVFVEVAPLHMISLSRMDMHDYGKYYTGGHPLLSVPRLFYILMDFDLNTFMDRFNQNPFVPSPIVGIHPAKLRDAILDMESKPQSRSKGLALHNVLARQSYRSIKRGLMFMEESQEKFFPMPSLEQIEEENYPFYKSM
ncbi:MAG: hypothetical protein WDA02_02365 [Saccharofermentanales bacterium]